MIIIIASLKKYHHDDNAKYHDIAWWGIGSCSTPPRQLASSIGWNKTDIIDYVNYNS